MIKCFYNKKIINISKGSYTTKLVIKNFKDKIINSKTDLYIKAIGTNDIRYRTSNICAMNSKEYLYQLQKLVEFAKNNESKFIFIAPWFSTSDDYISKINHFAKKKLMKQYSLELEKFCQKNNYVYRNPNNYIERIILKNKTKFMIDYIHPNKKNGIELYCEGVFINQ